MYDPCDLEPTPREIHRNFNYLFEQLDRKYGLWNRLQDDLAVQIKQTDAIITYYCENFEQTKRFLKHFLQMKHKS